MQVRLAVDLSQYDVTFPDAPGRAQKNSVARGDGRKHALASGDNPHFSSLPRNFASDFH